MRVNVFDKAVASPRQIRPKAVWLGIILVILATVALSYGLINLRISSVEGRLDQLANRPIVVQFGKNAELVKVEPVSPSENVEEFVQEVLPPMFAWSKKVLPEVHPTGIDPGRDTKYGKLPTLIFYYTNALEIRYRNVFRKNIANYKPEKFEQGEATLLRIERLVKPRQTEEGWEVDVYADLITLDVDDVAYMSEPFNSTIHIKEILPPKHNASFTPIEEAFVAVQKRGLIITRIAKLEA